MNYLLDPGYTKRWLLFLWLSGIFIHSITSSVIYFKIQPGATSLALHYTVLTGVDLFGRASDIYKIPLTGFGISLLNWILARTLGRNERFFVWFLAISQLIIGIILLGAVLLLLQVN
jgi:hypothetical protein